MLYERLKKEFFFRFLSGLENKNSLFFCFLIQHHQKKKKKQELPRPTNPNVKLRDVPSKVSAVLGWRGGPRADEEMVAARRRELDEALRKAGIKVLPGAGVSLSGFVFCFPPSDTCSSPPSFLPLFLSPAFFLIATTKTKKLKTQTTLNQYYPPFAPAWQRL